MYFQIYYIIAFIVKGEINLNFQNFLIYFSSRETQGERRRERERERNVFRTELRFLLIGDVEVNYVNNAILVGLEVIKS